jgi:hypothetical protein
MRKKMQSNQVVTAGRRKSVLVVNRRKRGRGRPATGKNTMIGIRWPRVLLAGIDSYAQEKRIERHAALKEIVARFLVQHSYLVAHESARS